MNTASAPQSSIPNTPAPPTAMPSLNANTNASASASAISGVSTGFSLLGLFSSFDWRVWLFIVFILAFLGVNIFVYLAEGTQTITDILAPITTYLGNLFGGTLVDATKQAVNVSATGAKAGVDIAAGTVTTGLDVAQQTASGVKGATSSTTNQNNETVSTATPDYTSSTNALNAALNSATSSVKQTGGTNLDTPTYEADDSYSSIQASKTAGKAGWCFIGEERGYRSCSQVGENDKCMSGDIFPSQEICVNPNLRT
jgi:hypothetical protein